MRRSLAPSQILKQSQQPESPSTPSPGGRRRSCAGKKRRYKDSDDEDDTAELLAELQKIKKERAAEKAKMVINYVLAFPGAGFFRIYTEICIRDVLCAEMMQENKSF